MKLKFDTHGNEKQKECARHWIDPEATDIVYGGSKGSAKSYTGCSLIFGDAFIYPETHYFIARTTLTDLRKFTIPSIYEVFQHWGLNEKYYKYNGQDNYFQLYNKSRVYLLDAKYLPSDPLYMRFGSMQMTRGWIEEAGEFEESAKNNLAASIGRWKNDVYNLTGKLLQTCNPSKNYLYREYYKKHKSNNLEPWKRFIQALPTDNKMLPEGYIENLKRSLSPQQIERLLLGNWEYDDDPSTLIDYDSITDYFNNQHVLAFGKKYITVDVARLGSDETVIRVWHGWRCIKRVVLRKSRVDDTAKEIRKLAIIHQVPMSQVVVDEDGVGGGVVDILRCKGFVNNSRPLKEDGKDVNYANLKAQCSFKMAQRIVNKELYEECGEPEIKEKIIEEMEQVKEKDLDKDGKKNILSRQEVIERIGRSPDDWSSIMMREFFELAPKKHYIKKR